MKKVLLIISALFLTACAPAPSPPMEEDAVLVVEEVVGELAEEPINLESDKPVWSSTGPSVFTSKKFKLKLTVPKNIAVHDRHEDPLEVWFTSDPEAVIDKNGEITFGTPYLWGKMVAKPGKKVIDFLREEHSHNHKIIQRSEFIQNGKNVLHYSFSARCEGFETMDDIYVVEHNGYLMEFRGHECADLGEVVKTLRFFEEVPDENVIEEPRFDNDPQYSRYKQWIVPIKHLQFLKSEREKERKDCIGLLNGLTEGGDLLSSLIADNEARDLMNLERYTKEYILNLEQKIVNKTHQKHQSDFYAFYVCNLDNDLNVIAGDLFPTGESTIIESDKGAGSPKYSDDKVFIIAHKNNIYIYEDIQLMDASLTGAETLPCQSRLESNKVLWDCVKGFGETESGEMGLRMKNYEFPLDGTSPLIKESINKVNLR
ncbi:hypothetical protein ACFL6I_11425 [candidate division KSB1 bacterium]